MPFASGNSNSSLDGHRYFSIRSNRGGRETIRARLCFSGMTEIELFDQSYYVARNVLERTGELGEPNETSRFLIHNIAYMMTRGERRRLLLSNSAMMPTGVPRLVSFRN